MKLTDREFVQLSDFIKKNYGIYLKEEKKSLIETRLSDMLTKKDIPSFSQLYTMLLQDSSGELKKELATRITTNYTYFMREEDTFSFFSQNVLPWIEKVCIDKSLRAWSAGCSTGEEPYNLAMIIADYFINKDKTWDKQILASVISERVLLSAKQGIYSAEKIECLPQHWKSRYLEKYDEDSEPGTVIEQSPKYGEKVNSEVVVEIYINSYKGEEPEVPDEPENTENTSDTE